MHFHGCPHAAQLVIDMPIITIVARLQHIRRTLSTLSLTGLVHTELKSDKGATLRH